MKPLNYAIQKHVTKVQEASACEIMEALKDQYGHFKAFKKDSILSALMTAEANGLLEESRFDMDESNELRVYFRAHEEGAATINRYIKD
jgi:DNA-binding PadR family transcriptional regulator